MTALLGLRSLRVLDAWRCVMRRMVLVGLVLVVVAGVGVAASAAAPVPGGTVYIATGENFPDAVTAGAAGGAADGPVLLVRQNSIPTPTLDEVNRLQPFKIVIVGGTAVISVGVEDQLKALSFSPVVIRQGGADRYETAALLSAGTFPKVGAVSCPGTGFSPNNSTASYDGQFARWHLGSFLVSFLCDVSLPHRATVTKLSVGINDTDNTAGGSCALIRVNIVGGGFIDEIGKVDAMATTPATSTPGMPGKVALSTTTIADAFVNNFRYGYVVTCSTTFNVRIIGAVIEYELTD